MQETQPNSTDTQQVTVDAGQPADGLQATELSRDETAASKAIGAAVGQIVRILMFAQPYRNFSIADLEWMVLPAVATGQFLLIEGKPKANEKSAVLPIAVAFWAHLSDDVGERLRQSRSAAVWRLAPTEWRSGSTPWLLDIVSPPDLVEPIRSQLSEKVFQGQPFEQWRLRKPLDGEQEAMG